jgi:hypothetical protein
MCSNQQTSSAASLPCKEILALSVWLCLSLHNLGCQFACHLSSLVNAIKVFSLQFVQLYLVVKTGVTPCKLCTCQPWSLKLSALMLINDFFITFFLLVRCLFFFIFCFFFCCCSGQLRLNDNQKSWVTAYWGREGI